MTEVVGKKLSGRAVKLSIFDDKKERVIGGQQSGTFARTATGIDVTSKDTEGGYAESIPGQKAWQISGGGVYPEGDPAIDYMEEKYENDENINIGYMFKSGRGYKGSATLTSFSIEAPHDGAVTVSYEFQGNGKPEKVSVGTGPEEPGEQDPVSRMSLMKMNKSELTELAEEQAVELPANATKEAIVDLLDETSKGNVVAD